MLRFSWLLAEVVQGKKCLQGLQPGIAGLSRDYTAIVGGC